MYISNIEDNGKQYTMGNIKYLSPDTFDFIRFDWNYLTLHPASYVYSQCNTVSHCLTIIYTPYMHSDWLNAWH